MSGLVMSELILDGASKTVDLSAFSASRYVRKRRKGTRGRKKGSEDVGEQW